MTVKDFIDSTLHSDDIEMIVIEEQDETQHSVEVTAAANAANHNLEKRILDLEVKCFWVDAAQKQIIVYTKETEGGNKK